MTQKEFSKIMAAIAASYPDVNLTAETNKVYYSQLKDIDYEVCRLAVQQIIQTSQFFPRIAQIREKCASVSNPATDISTVDAINVLTNSISKFGYYRVDEALEYIKGQSETLYEIAKALGYRNICTSDLQRFRTEIESLYREANKEQKEKAMISGEVKSKVAQLAGKMRSNALLMQSDDFY